MKKYIPPSLLIVLFTFTSYVMGGTDAFNSSHAVKPHIEQFQADFKNYADVITEDAVTQRGVFTTHLIKDKLFYEIPSEMLGKEFLWLVQVSKTQAKQGVIGGYSQKAYVRFEYLNGHILLRKIDFDYRATDGSNEASVVKDSSIDGIIAALKIQALGKNNSLVIDMSSVFKKDLPEFSVKKAIKAKSLEKNRVFITSVKTFEKNIETRVLATFKKDSKTKRFITAEVHHSLLTLPEAPMRARFKDSRVGFLSSSYYDFSSPQSVVEKRLLAKRFRLEKKYPAAEVSEPIKPIVFYIGRGVPKKWHQSISDGVEAWQVAFEQAGFKNAIMTKIAPSKAEDPNWDPEDARYSTIRWIPTTSNNASGPSVIDPRTGEIIVADILINSHLLSRYINTYLVQMGAVDPRASMNPLPDELLNKMMAKVITHEVGHTLGLAHNRQASSHYPVEKLRDAEFLKEYGIMASVMDYARFNYVAQPGDKVPTVPNSLGPYDKFAIEWGYKVFPKTKNAEEDIPFLNKIADRQLSNPMLSFGDKKGDPSSQTEDLGDNAIQASTYGLKNLEVISSLLIDASARKGKGYKKLSRLYGALLWQMKEEIDHVIANIGGVVFDNRLTSEHNNKNVYIPRSAAEQKAAMAFIQQQAFKTQDFLLNPEIIKRIGSETVVSSIAKNQKGYLAKLLDPKVVDRLIMLSVTGYKTYRAEQLFADLSDGIFSELTSNQPTVDLFRRKLQAYFVNYLLKMLAKDSKANSDYRSLARHTLMSLEKSLYEAIAKSEDSLSKMHLTELVEKIKSVKAS